MYLCDFMSPLKDPPPPRDRRRVIVVVLIGRARTNLKRDDTLRGREGLRDPDGNVTTIYQ